MKKTMSIFLGVFITILVINTGAGASGTLTEDEAAELALKNNLGLISAEKMKQAASAESWKSYWLPNPMLGMENMNGEGGLFSSGTKKLVISQKIPFPVKQVFKAAAAHEKSDMFAYAYEKKKWEILAETKGVYYEIYRLDRVIEIMDETVQVVRQFARTASSKYATGSVSQQDVLKAEVEYARLQNELITLNQKRDTAFAKFEALLGGEGALGKEEKLLKPEIPEMNEDFGTIKEMVINSPAYKKADSDRKAGENLRNAALAAYIPDLNVVYKKHIDQPGNNYDIMFEVSVPLWFAFNDQPDAGAAADKAEAGINYLKDTYNNAVAEAKEHYEIIKATGRLVKLYENTLIPQAETAFRSSQSAYQSGQIEFINLLDSERTLLNFRVEYYGKLAEYLTHFRQLEALLGAELTSDSKPEKNSKGDEYNEK